MKRFRYMDDLAVTAGAFLADLSSERVSNNVINLKTCLFD